MSTQSTPTDREEVERIEALKAADMQPIRFIGELQKLKVEPGDVFVLTCEAIISDEQAQQLQARFEARLPGSKCIVLGRGLKLDVVQLPDFEKSVTDVMVKAGVLVRPTAD